MLTIHLRYPLQILAFPCNQFGSQEPEADVDVIRKDIKQRFGVNFSIYDKLDVNGADTHPLYLVSLCTSPYYNRTARLVCL
jgi:glutathione peroxidase-family protein